jgi:hydrogenase expression/formation protein HypE
MPDGSPLPVGKLAPELLAELLADDEEADPRVILGPGIGRDVAVLDFGDRALVAKSDPVTFATDELGWYAVHVNANDIATAGAQPKWFLGTLLLPEGKSTSEIVKRVFAQIRRACAEIGVSLVGGHTEITYGLDRPILCGQMLGEVDKEKLVLPTGIRVGDAILMTKAIAVEGTSILARELADRLKAGGCSDDEIERGAQHLFKPGISVTPDALALTSAVRVHAMHDPTEGGLASGLWEMAQAGDVGIDARPDPIPRLPLCERFCRVLAVEPLGLIASGTLLAAVDPADVPSALAACDEAGIECTEIGVATDRKGEVREHTPDGWQPMRRFDQDELARLFAEGA